MEKVYTVSEVDALREVLQRRWLCGTSYPKVGTGPTMSRSFEEAEMVECVEPLLRTHMLAGHTAQDILDADR